MRFPTREDIVTLNRLHLQQSGEEYFLPENLLNSDSPDWVLYVIQHPVYGDVSICPTLSSKAAKLAYVIITRHVFVEGNHRTGMSALEWFLRWNGYRLSATDDEIEEIGYRIDTPDPQRRASFQELVEWVETRKVPSATTFQESL